MVTYRELIASDLPNVKRLYEEEGWTAYLNDDARLYRAWDGSLYALGAFDGDALIGFVRCLGDGAHTVLIQDLIIIEDRRRRTIGRTLVEAVAEKYADVRQLFVVTDDESPAVDFYRAIGFYPFSDGGLTAFFRWQAGV